MLLFLYFFRQMTTTCLLRDICLCHVKSFNILNGTKQECQEKNVAVKSNMISFQIRIAFLLSKKYQLFSLFTSRNILFISFKLTSFKLFWEHFSKCMWHSLHDGSLKVNYSSTYDTEKQLELKIASWNIYMPNMKKAITF